MTGAAAGAATGAGPERWAVRWRKAPAPRMRLFCVPHSGAGAAVYRTWAPLLPDGVELVAVRPPGRESRFREPAFAAMDALVPAMVRGLAPLLDVPHAWFGHSGGALVAFEACREIRRRGLPEPVRLAVSSRPAPHLAARSVSVLGLPGGTPVRDATDAELASLVAALNGAPAGAAERAAATLAPFVPTLRADLSVIETYRYRPEPPLDLPVSAFGGDEDPGASADDLRAWDVHTGAGCTVRTFPGGHFYLHRGGDAFVAALAGELRAG